MKKILILFLVISFMFSSAAFATDFIISNFTNYDVEIIRTDHHECVALSKTTNNLKVPRQTSSTDPGYGVFHVDFNGIICPSSYIEVKLIGLPHAKHKTCKLASGDSNTIGIYNSGFDIGAGDCIPA